MGRIVERINIGRRGEYLENSEYSLRKRLRPC